MTHALRAVALAILALGGTAHDAHAQQPPGVDFSQVTRPVVEVADSATIEFLLFELFLEPLRPPSRLQVVDVTQNGFGPDDVVIAYPSAEAFLIPEFVPDTVQVIMGAWVPEVEYRMDSGNMPSSALAALIGSEPDRAKRAESAIMYDLVQAVERSYRDLPVSILFQRDSVGFSFQLWDYNRGAMEYAPRPAFVADSAVTTVLAVLEEVGYVPGENVVGLGVSLAAEGRSVASVDRALVGIMRLPDDQMRSLAVRTVLLGSYDYDRSGAIDQAREVDAPSCDIWIVLEDAFPGFLEDLGFRGSDTPYLGNVAFSIARNVRGPAERRASACLAGEAPPATQPSEVQEVGAAVDVPPEALGFVALSAGAEIVRRAGGFGPGSADWSREVRAVLLERFDQDRSGLLDREAEVRSVPCAAWQAIASTHPAVRDALVAGEASVLGDLGLASGRWTLATSAAARCIAPQAAAASLRVPAARTSRAQLPPESIRTAVTIPLRGLLRVPEEEGRYLPAKTVLLAMFDLDRSGSVDTAGELDAIPCEVWEAFEITFPDFAARYGFLDPSPDRPYRGNLLFSVSDRLREPAARRIRACERGDPPPPTAPATAEPSGTRTMTVPARLKEFLDLEAAATLARSGIAASPGSAAWAATVRSVLLERYDLDGSGRLDGPDELAEVPCVVWRTVETTYGAPLEDLLTATGEQRLGEQVGIADTHDAAALHRVQACRR